jgi:DNA-directed RNA polymerase specialized sigma subunit
LRSLNKDEQIINSKKNSNNDDKREVKDYIFLLEETVKEFKNSGEPSEKLRQVGYLGLLNSINLQGTKNDEIFQENTRHLIAGEIRNYIREKHKKVKVPAWLKMINNLIDRVLIAYYRQFKKYPDIKELSQLLNMSPEGLKETLKARESVHKVSIDKNRRAGDIKEPPDYAKIKKEMKKKGNG